MDSNQLLATTSSETPSTPGLLWKARSGRSDGRKRTRPAENCLREIYYILSYVVNCQMKPEAEVARRYRRWSDRTPELGESRFGRKSTKHSSTDKGRGVYLIFLGTRCKRKVFEQLDSNQLLVISESSTSIECPSVWRLCNSEGNNLGHLTAARPGKGLIFFKNCRLVLTRKNNSANCTQCLAYLLTSLSPSQ